MKTTKIEWTDSTWNPTTGCTKISEGCRHCYAATMALRLKAMGIKKYREGFELVLHPETLNEPLKWKQSRTIFVNSMSDLFHKDIPFEFIDQVFEVIKHTPQHRYQVLTKRADILKQYFATRRVPTNVWLGVTVENPKVKSRIDDLRDIPATVKFLSCEPLLEDLGSMDLTNIDWVIVGGESGTNARPMKEEWVLNIEKQCRIQGSAFFFKQWGTWGADGFKRNNKENGKLLQGYVKQEYPTFV